MLSRSAASTTSTAKWLSVVGIGEDGVAGLGDTARRLIAEAEIVFGGKRHLALAQSLIAGEARVWPTPFDASMQAVCALSGRKICVLASGDPYLFGVGATLSRVVPAEEMVVVPSPSSFSLAASRLGWPLQDVETVSLHGRSIDIVRPLLHPGRRIIALTSDDAGPGMLASLLAGTGFGQSTLTVMEALGGPDENIRVSMADPFKLAEIQPLNVVAIEVAASREARVLPLASGLSDDLFEHDGQITKREIRALTLSSLAPRRGELLWDIGAGSGSIGIQWMMTDPSMRAIAIEMHPDRAARIRGNAAACGVPDLKIITGSAPQALEGLPIPDAIFIGGGGSATGVVDSAISSLRSGGRLVANAVTLEMEAVLLALHARLVGSLIRIALSRAEPVGAMNGWRSAMPVTQWVWTKP